MCSPQNKKQQNGYLGSFEILLTVALCCYNMLWVLFYNISLFLFLVWLIILEFANWTNCAKINKHTREQENQNIYISLT